MFKIYVGDLRPEINTPVMLWASFALATDANLFSDQTKQQNPNWFVYQGLSLDEAKKALKSARSGGLAK